MTKKKPEAPPSPFAALRGMRDRMAKEAEEAEKQKKAPAAKAPPKASKPSSSSSSSSSSSREELDFHRLMSGVTPLDDKRGRVAKTNVPREARPAAKAPPPEDTTMEHLRVLVEEGSKFEVTDDGRRVEGHRVDVPPDFVRKLRRGNFPIDGQLDLHGASAGEAREALATFLRDKRARGERVVLVVHGKGEHSPGGVGVLRGEISAWLSQGAASHHVAAFCTAQDTDGGSGAVYVLLRR